MKTYKVILSAALSLCLAACSDFLDKKPLDKLSESSVFNSDALAESYVNALYSSLPDPMQEGNIGCICDEGYFRYGGSSTRYMYDGRLSPDTIIPEEDGGPAHNSRTTYLNIWNRAYEFIYRMNYFINYVQTEKTELSETTKTRLLGETYYLRAWTYFSLIQRYAGVPIITKVFSLNDSFGVKRDNYDDCVDFILQDLETAEGMLPAKENYAQGRINKDVAKALRSRLTLVAASPLFNDPENPEGGIFRGKYDPEKWERAYQASKAIVDRADLEGAYALGDTYEDMWKNVNSPELIWAKYFVPTTSGNKAQLLYSIVQYSGWTCMEPTQAMAMDYEMTNGKKFFEDDSGYDPKHPFRNRDPRFYKSIAEPFSTYGYTENGKYNEVELQFQLQYGDPQSGKFVSLSEFDKGKAMPDHDKVGRDLWSATSGMDLELRKWYIPELPIVEAETGTLLYPWFRLAEMYLNLAECAYNTGRESECREYINKIRDRKDVMMPHVTESGEALWDRLVNERRIELAFEAFRYFDIRRWKTAEFYEKIPIAGMKTMVVCTSATKQDTLYRVVRRYDESKNDKCYYYDNLPSDQQNLSEVPQHVFTYRWLGKDYKIDFGDCCLGVTPTQKRFPEVGGVYSNYLMPIPRNEITKSEGSIEQNPGY